MFSRLLGTLKELPTERVRHFVSSSLMPSYRIEEDGKAYMFYSEHAEARVTKTTLRALAAALLAACSGTGDVGYEALWKHSTERHDKELSAQGRRKFAEQLRRDWQDILSACPSLAPSDRSPLPHSDERILLSTLFPPFDRARTTRAMYALDPPSLEVYHQGQAKPSICLDLLVPGEWKMVGHSRSAEPPGKIAISYDRHLPRQAFEIKLCGSVLHVRAVEGATNKPVYLDKPSMEFELHEGGEFRVGDLTFRLTGTAGGSDTATPRFIPGGSPPILA